MSMLRSDRRSGSAIVVCASDRSQVGKTGKLLEAVAIAKWDNRRGLFVGRKGRSHWGVGRRAIAISISCSKCDRPEVRSLKVSTIAFTVCSNVGDYIRPSE